MAFFEYFCARYLIGGINYSMASNRQYVLLEIAKELLWWMLSAILALVVMYPLISTLHYKPIWLNGALLVVAFTYFRYAVFLRTVWALRSKYVRVALVIFNINFFIFVLSRMQSFMHIYDSFSLDAMGTPIRAMKPEDVDPLFRYFFDEINFTCVACLVLAAALSVRIIIAHWNTAHLRLNAGSEE